MLLLSQAWDCQSRRVIRCQKSVDYDLCLVPRQAIDVEAMVALKRAYLLLKFRIKHRS